VSRVGDWVDRVRGRTRRDEIGVDDGEGVVAAPERRVAVAARVPAPSDHRPVPPQAPEPVEKRRVTVPHGVEIATAWSWRFVIIVLAMYFIVRAIDFFEVVLVPVVVAVFLAALVVPAVELLQRFMPRGLAAGFVVIALIAFVVGLLVLVGQQIGSGVDDLAAQVSDGIGKIQDWLQTGPLHLTQSQLDDALAKARATVSSGNTNLATRVASVGATLGHVVAGVFIALFSTYFFLYQGGQIWSWIVGLFPKAARSRADGSGRAAWVSLTSFVRATVIVAFTDAVGITLVAVVLRVPLAFPIGVLVFLGSFVPVVGATVSGSVAVLVALVAHGPLAALLMLAGVIGVQQLEAHVLQPFLLGRAVSLHPLAVILAIAAGVLAAGIVGALVAVPLVAVLNTIVKYLSAPEPDEEVGLEAAPG